MFDCAHALGGQSIAAAQANFALAHPENILLSRSQKKRAALRQRLTTATVRACKAELERNVALDLLTAETTERVNALERLELRNKNWAERVNRIKAQRDLNQRAIVKLTRERDHERMVLQHLKLNSERQGTL